MVKITLNKDSQNLENQNIHQAFEKLGIQFDCNNGTCGLCKIKVLTGEEKVNSKTESEEYFPLEKKERLACQCHKITGDIKIENAE